MTIEVSNSEETERAFAECERNGWRVSAMARGATNSAWVLTVDTGPEAPMQPNLLEVSEHSPACDARHTVPRPPQETSNNQVVPGYRKLTMANRAKCTKPLSRMTL
jgi:hypothetical protein